MSRHGVFKVFVILSIFLAGALSGAAVVRVLSDEGASVAEREVAETTSAEGEATGSGDSGFGDGGRVSPYAFVRFLEEELNLTSEQRAEVQAIVERRAAEARRMFVESRERFREHLEGTVEEVEAVLPEEQAREFHRLMDAMERRFQREGDRRELRDRREGPLR